MIKKGPLSTEYIRLETEEYMDFHYKKLVEVLLRLAFHTKLACTLCLTK
jgi:hypothetical protein